MQIFKTILELYDAKLEVGDYFILNLDEKKTIKYSMYPIIKISKQELIIIKLKGNTTIYQALKIEEGGFLEYYSYFFVDD